jgi:hypothetical protein
MEQQALIDALHAPPPIPVALAPGAVPKVVTEILNEAVIAAAATTVLGDCVSIDMHTSGYNTLAITIETTYNAAATRGIRLHVLTSYDDADYDTEDWDMWEPNFAAGATIRQTKIYDTDPAYVRILVENLDAAQAVTNTIIHSTAG